MGLVNDVADILERAAAGPLHTPALYSCFLRALVSAKTEPSSSETEGQSLQTSNSHTTSHELNGAASGSNMNVAPAVDPLAEFQFDSEMGPVADMSTFPPTMAPFPTEDNFGMLTMDSILSASFWDSVLVPGKSPFSFVSTAIVSRSCLISVLQGTRIQWRASAADSCTVQAEVG